MKHLLRLWTTLILLCSGLLHGQNSCAQTLAAPPSDTVVGTASWGTGFVIAPGHVLTAYHVIQQRQLLLVGPVGTSQTNRNPWIKAELIKADPALDLALLKVNLNLPALKLHPHKSIPIGLEAYVIGFPQPRIQGSSKKITAGIVNGYRNSSPHPSEEGWLQISAEVSKGNSGGPVLAPDGTVIGMLQRKIHALRAATKTQDILVNVAYALRSEQIVEFLKSTPVSFETQAIDLNTLLRPYQVFELHQQSVLAVMGRAQTPRPDSSDASD